MRDPQFARLAKWRNVLAKVVFAGAASIASAASASIVSAGEPADAILKTYATQLVPDGKAPWRFTARMLRVS